MLNKNTKIKVLVIAVKDDRKRFKFLMKPLNITKTIESEVVLKMKSYPVFLVRLLLKAVRFKPDLIIAVEADIIGFSAILLNKLILRSKPVILRSGGDSISPRLTSFRTFLSSRGERSFKETLRFYKDRILHTLSMYVYDTCSHFIVVNNSHAQEFQKFINLKNRKIFIVPQCLTVEHPNRPRKWATKDTISFLTVTNLRYEGKYRGLLELVRYLQRYVSEGHVKKRKFLLQICGDGYYYSRLLDYINTIADKNNALRIRCHGYVRKPSPYYSNADLFMYVSYFDALPNVLLEAQAYGLPILVNDYLPFQESLTDHWNTVFYRSGDFEDFRAKLDELMTNANLRKRLSANGMKNIMENYSPETIAVKLERVINEISNYPR
ncbi:MAG: glycosyltransferase family 4 protein [Candidatus Hodarchaeota archaeon]